MSDILLDFRKFVDLIEGRAMACDGPVTPFLEELHAASDAEKERFTAILAKIYQSAPNAEDQIKHMMSRFLSWKLPENFSPDAGISFKKTFNEHTAHPMKHEPTGTNLLDAAQAEAMIRYLLDDLPSPQTHPPGRLAMANGLVEGGYYRSRDGGVHGPMIHELVAHVFKSPLNGFWDANGKHSWNTGPDHPLDLVERVSVSAFTPSPQPNVTAGVLLCQDIVDLAIKTLTAAEYLSEEAAQDAVRVRKALRDATATGSALDDLAPNGPVTGNQLREILGLEPEEGLDPDDDGNIRTCAGEWVKNKETGLWAFEEDEDD